MLQELFTENGNVMSIGRIIQTPECVAEGATFLAQKDAHFAQALAQQESVLLPLYLELLKYLLMLF